MTDSIRLSVLVFAMGFSTLSRPASAQTAPVAPVQPPTAVAPALTAAPAVAPSPTPTSIASPAPFPGAPATAAYAVQPVPPPGYVLVPVGAPAPAPAPAPEPPQEMAYVPSQPIPAGYHVEEQVRKGLVIAGSVTLGVSWVFSATAAVGDDFNHKTGFLMIPALGPWLMLAAGGASDDCNTDSLDSSYEYCHNKSDVRAWLFLDGIAQTAGAIMLATGIGYPRKRLVRNDFAVSFAPTPLSRDGFGLGAIGTF